jgi:hypothetical protein
MKVSSMVLKLAVAVATSAVSVSAFAVLSSSSQKEAGADTTVSTCPHQKQIKDIREATAFVKPKSPAPRDNKNVKSNDGVG